MSEQNKNFVPDEWEDGETPQGHNSNQQHQNQALQGGQLSEKQLIHNKDSIGGGESERQLLQNYNNLNSKPNQGIKKESKQSKVRSRSSSSSSSSDASNNRDRHHNSKKRSKDKLSRSISRSRSSSREHKKHGNGNSGKHTKSDRDRDSRSHRSDKRPSDSSNNRRHPSDQSQSQQPSSGSRYVSQNDFDNKFKQLGSNNNGNGVGGNPSNSFTQDTNYAAWGSKPQPSLTGQPHQGLGYNNPNNSLGYGPSATGGNQNYGNDNQYGGNLSNQFVKSYPISGPSDPSYRTTQPPPYNNVSYDNYGNIIPSGSSQGGYVNQNDQVYYGQGQSQQSNPSSGQPGYGVTPPVIPGGGVLDEQSQQYYKTKMCPHYENGTCYKGAQCQFAHGDHERRTTPNFAKTRICNNFQNGNCMFGSSCQFAHGQQELRVVDENAGQVFGGGYSAPYNVTPTPPPPPNTGNNAWGQQPIPNNAKTIPCQYFMMAKCIHNNTCKFSHDPAILSGAGSGGAPSGYPQSIPPPPPSSMDMYGGAYGDSHIGQPNHYNSYNVNAPHLGGSSSGAIKDPGDPYQQYYSNAPGGYAPTGNQYDSYYGSQQSNPHSQVHGYQGGSQYGHDPSLNSHYANIQPPQPINNNIIRGGIAPNPNAPPPPSNPNPGNYYNDPYYGAYYPNQQPPPPPPPPTQSQQQPQQNQYQPPPLQQAPGEIVYGNSNYAQINSNNLDNNTLNNNEGYYQNINNNVLLQKSSNSDISIESLQQQLQPPNQKGLDQGVAGETGSHQTNLNSDLNPV